MKRLYALTTAAALLLLGASCGQDDDCDPYSCECGLATASLGGSGQPASCVGAPLCNVDDECPAPHEGDTTPICQSHGDLVQNGFGGQCVLPCTDSCPGEMTCIGGQCRFLLDEPGDP